MDPHLALDPGLLEILVCPACHGALVVEPEAADPRTLRCTSGECALTYPVRDGIPVLLVDQATRGPAPEDDRDDH